MIFDEDLQVMHVARAMESPSFDRLRDEFGRDPFDSLVAQLGRERGVRVWDRACQSFDWKHAPEEFSNGRPSGAVDY